MIINYLRRANWQRSQVGIVVLLGIFFFLPLAPIQGQTIGDILPRWTPGTLDIHHINTGKGESTLVILPDATSLLLDAGAVQGRPPTVAPARPDSSREPGEWIARYAASVLPAQHKSRLDYVLISHFHGDHMGYVSERSVTAANSEYQLAGLTEIAEYLKIDKLIDRGWPDYNYPRPLNNLTMTNYRAFIDWQIENRGLHVEKFQPGSNQQIVLKYEADRYANFEIRNIASNGNIWTGVRDETKSHFPALETLDRVDWPSENMCSNVIRLTYGKFDYYTGGDIPGVSDTGIPKWHDVETPVAKAVGAVDVHSVNHHGYPDVANPVFLATLRPRVNILHAWSPTHPGTRVLYRLFSERLYQGPRDTFITNLLPESKIVLGRWMIKFQSEQGHIVVRVAPGGDEYVVIILDDNSEELRVIAVHGPYRSS